MPKGQVRFDKFTNKMISFSEQDSDEELGTIGNMEYTLLCLTSRTTVTSACIPDEDACHRALNLCVISHIQKGTPGLMHKGCVLQRVSLGALSDFTVVLGIRQSLV